LEEGATKRTICIQTHRQRVMGRICRRRRIWYWTA